MQTLIKCTKKWVLRTKNSRENAPFRVLGTKTGAKTSDFLDFSSFLQYAKRENRSIFDQKTIILSFFLFNSLQNRFYSSLGGSKKSILRLHCAQQNTNIKRTYVTHAYPQNRFFQPIEGWASLYVWGGAPPPWDPPRFWRANSIQYWDFPLGFGFSDQNLTFCGFFRKKPFFLSLYATKWVSRVRMDPGGRSWRHTSHRGRCTVPRVIMAVTQYKMSGFQMQTLIKPLIFTSIFIRFSIGSPLKRVGSGPISSPSEKFEVFGAPRGSILYANFDKMY